MEAIVEFNYEAQEPDELTLKKGDIITDIKKILGGWWEGTLRDKRGMFPDNFVKVLEPLSSGSTGSGGCEVVNSAKPEEVTLRNGGSRRRFCKVVFSYEPCNEDELTLIPQDSIEFLGEVEDGWWRGRLKGRVGVFPSNFVSPPVYEESDKHKDQDKKETCKVLYSYEAANEDELTLSEGDIITLLSRDVPDEGWWLGELKGQVGLFPDNFVEIINSGTDHTDHEQRYESSVKSLTKHTDRVKKSKKAHVRKSLDIRNVNSETTKKTISTNSPSVTTSTSPGVGGSSGDRKSGGHLIISNLKRLVRDVGTNNDNGSTNTALGEELDGVERGEGAPLSHLTASRAKAPRRRPPSSRHLRHHATGSTITTTNAITLEDNLANGNADTTLEQLREEETELAGLAAKARRKAPWVEELKLNQLERRKIGSIDRVDKSEVKKERSYPRLTALTATELINKLKTKSEEIKTKDKSPKSDTSPHLEQGLPTSGTPDYVPYALYSQLLERVATLEEKQATLQQIVGLLLEQFVPLLSSINSPTD
ncbi:SH3 domain-containing kinase-binding protein 1-like [Hylaeus volcanicus]|uniref:SH3 domain-containing kinase-binding protein 1-like n=1 Tax=Hylaeus volcanicus TaxID=313075 RepID=UPI0023B7B902|nr:SH3 domain-containing kinase-binding protein 1-like [Hylaeus volcanicus]XP_053975352.1 SH3 domain-containing kinase-binding protein 1-like [Hylaeus volcanicus]XP_053975353.1 SH3 domain-containing kinase-binding protein 1-like [Hylaeus volcanicus]XP_053975354.1 SH3 domain-containing kinase-binding protein 1-like [Hylaeus volcanicus]XP_053975356.1 SH3 domain-containing kinase-binding protein 1-like [Hylaeus volcanicus]